MFSPPMLAELLAVSPALVRAWIKRGWLIPSRVEHKLALLDFAEVSIGRQLAALHQGGLSGERLARKLAEIERHFPEIERPLAELTFVVDGRRLLVRRGGELLDPAGQRQLDFSGLEEESQVATTIPSPAAIALRDEPPPPDQLLEWAGELEEAGDLPTAAEMYRAALLATGPLPEVCFRLGELLYRLGETAAARERYAMAVELDEDFVEARCNLGCVMAELGQPELAAAAVEGALAHHPDYADAHWHLARIHEGLGNSEKSFVHLERFLSLAPDSPWADEARHKLAAAAPSRQDQ
ncbi:MAG: tetratricopeptide repeat protein [Pirellulaceae bacterium]